MMDWTEYQEGLLDEGYERLPIRTVEARRTHNVPCLDCGKKCLRPRPFQNSNKEYILYQVCDWCGYYREI